MTAGLPSAAQYDIDGCRLAITTLGAGAEHYVLIHGIGVSPRYFLPLARELARHGTVHLVVLPGFGGTPKPPRPLSMRDFANLVRQGLGRAGAVDPLLVGHSMGCQITVEMALADATERTEAAEQRDPAAGPPGPAARGLVLLGPTVNRAEPAAWQQGLRLAQDTCREPARVNGIIFSDYVRCGPRWYLRTLPRMLAHDMVQRIALVDVPVLILRGERDPIAPDYWVRNLAAACPEASAHSVAGEAHVVMFRQPGTVAAYCRAMTAVP